jgi:hypothetical protein
LDSWPSSVNYKGAPLPFRLAIAVALRDSGRVRRSIRIPGFPRAPGPIMKQSEPVRSTLRLRLGRVVANNALVEGAI